MAKGNINIQCPWCGSSDQFKRLGIKLDSLVYGCWRNNYHRGKSIERLIVALIGCTWEQAKAIVGRDKNYKKPDDDMLQSIADGALLVEDRMDNVIKFPRLLLFDKTMRPFSGEWRAEKIFTNYLKSRFGVGTRHIIRNYKLRYCVSGKYQDRIIIPVFMERRLVTWVARSIHKDADIRYLALEKDKSVFPIENTIFNYDSSMHTGGSILFITEGAFDGMWLDFVASKRFCRAVSLFNMSIDGEQLSLLHNLSSVFDTVVLMLDKGEMVNTFNIADQLTFIGSKLKIWSEYPEGAADPAELSIKHINALINRVLQNGERE